MNIFGKKTITEKMEKNFETKRMENREVFHELNIRGQDPELLRTQVLELLEAMDYDITINKFAKFDDSEFENIFQAGRLKPLRAVLHAQKKVQTGSRFPIIWKPLLALSIISFIAYFITDHLENALNVAINESCFIIFGVAALILQH